MPAHYNMQNVLHWPNSNFSGRTIYEQIVKSVIYSKYDLQTFQTNKPTNNIWNEMDYWFHHNFKDTQAYRVWESGIDYLISTLDPAFVENLHGRPTNIMMFETPMYYFGDSNIPNLALPFTPGADLKEKRVDSSKQHRHVINGRLVIY